MAKYIIHFSVTKNEKNNIVDITEGTIFSDREMTNKIFSKLPIAQGADSFEYTCIPVEEGET